MPPRLKPFRTSYVPNPKLTAAECKAAAECIDSATVPGARYTVALTAGERRALERAKNKLGQAYNGRSKT